MSFGGAIFGFAVAMPIRPSMALVLLALGAALGACADDNGSQARHASISKDKYDQLMRSPRGQRRYHDVLSESKWAPRAQPGQTGARQPLRVPRAGTRDSAR